MPPSLEARSILSQFPGPVTLYPSRRGRIEALVGGVLLTVLVGSAVATKGGLAAWFWFAVLGLCTVVIAIAMRTGAGAMILDGDGFHSEGLLRGDRVRWQHVTNFHVGSIRGVEQVRYTDNQRTHWGLSKLEIAIWGCNATIGDTYGMSAGELARLMTLWRGRALGA